MVAATFVNPNIDPPTVSEFVVQNGYRTFNSGTDWGFFPFAAKYYNLKFKQTFSTDEAIKALSEGNALIVASMGIGYFTRNGHYIVLYAVDESNQQILVNDPNSITRTKASYDIFRKQTACYFIFYNPNTNDKNKEEDVDMAILNTKDSLNININDKKVYVENYIINDSTYVKLKDIVNLLSNNLSYNNNTKTIDIHNIPVKIIVNNKELDGIIVNDKSFAPVKLIVENLGKTAQWDNINNMVLIK